MWVSKEDVASMESLLKVGEVARNRVPEWPKWARMFHNIQKIRNVLEISTFGREEGEIFIFYYGELRKKLR